MDIEEFRRYGHQAVDFVADYHRDIRRYPVMSGVEPGAIRAQLPNGPPLRPESLESVMEQFFRDLDEIILPGLSHWQHPDFYAFFPSVAEPASIVADIVSSGLAVLGISWESSPALSELELHMINWVRQMVGLSHVWKGAIQDTASTSTFVALLSARERSTEYSMTRGGLQSEHRPLVVYMTSQAHSSVVKDAQLAGFGLANVRVIATDEQFAMLPDALAAAIEGDIALGYTPCAVVATVGTTATTALDPLEEIAKITQQYGVWLHVDAALAGAAMILPECRWMWQGIERADSLVINGHKWLGVVFDCSLYFVRDWQHLVRVMGTNPSYLQGDTDQAQNLRNTGIPLGRRFRALKVWILLCEQGVSGLQARLRRDIENAKWLAEHVRANDDWRVLAPVPLQTVCVRHEPVGITEDELDSHTLGWCERVNRSGKAYLTRAMLDGHWMVRVSIGALPTEREHVEALWSLMQREAGEQNEND